MLLWKGVQESKALLSLMQNDEIGIWRRIVTVENNALGNNRGEHEER